MKLKTLFPALLSDFMFFVYMLGCLVFLANTWLEFTANIWLIPAVSTGIVLLCLLPKNSMGHKVFEPFGEKEIKFLKSIFGWQILLGLVLTFVVGWNIVEVDLYKFFTKFGNAGGILSGLFDPNFKILTLCLAALAETIYLALLATIFAIPLAFVLSFFAARNLMPRTPLGNAIYILIRTIATIFRSVEAIVWAIIFSVWVGIGPFAGMLALMVHSVAALTKLYSEQIENIDVGPVEAIKATGASTLQVWIFAVIPQIVSPFLAFTIYRWDINVRMATIVGFVGGGGIGLLLLQQQQLLRWHNVGIIIWLIALVVWSMDMISARVREKLQGM